MTRTLRTLFLPCLILMLFCFSPISVFAIDINLGEPNCPFGDAAFRTWLIANVSTDGDKILSEEEMAAVTSLSPTGDDIVFIKGLENFPNLTSITLTGLPNLETAYCSNIKLLQTLTVSDCPNLSNVYCTKSDNTYTSVLEEITLSNLPSLSSFYCYNHVSLKNLYIDANTLTDLNCSNTSLTTLDVSKCTNLETLTCRATFDNPGKLSTIIGLQNCSNLQSLDCSYNQIQKLDLPSVANDLKTLNCSYNQITTLDVSGCLNLERLYCNNNALFTLDVGANKQLITLDCKNQAKITADNYKPEELGQCFQQPGWVFADKNSPATWKMDLRTLPGISDANVNNITDVDYGKIENGILTFSYDVQPDITYTYDTGFADEPLLITTSAYRIKNGVTIWCGGTFTGTEDNFKLFDVGETVSITATVGDDQKFYGWKQIHGDLSSTEKVWTFQMLDQAIMIYADTYDINTLSVTNGVIVSENGVDCTDPTKKDGKYTSKDKVVISPLSKEGYTFKDWTVVNESQSYTVTDTELVYWVGSDTTCTANYTPIDYTITVIDGTADKQTAHIGDKITLTPSSKEGKKFVKWTSEPEITFENNSFIMPTSDVTITAEYEYVYIAEVSGGNGTNEQSVIPNDKNTIVSTIQCEFSKFVDFYNGDQKLIKDVDYTAKEGSIILTLKPEYLKTLSVGKHTFTVQMTDGQAMFDINIELPKASQSPETGDDNEPALLVALVVFSLIGLVFVLRSKKTKMR